MDPDNDRIFESARARLAEAQSYAARRHLHMAETGRDLSPAVIVLPPRQYNALTGLSSSPLRISTWITIERGGPLHVDLAGDPVPPGRTCDDCGTADPPSLIGWPVEERSVVHVGKLGEMSAPRTVRAAPMLCEFCDRDRIDAGLRRNAD